NLLILTMGGQPGRAPILDDTNTEPMSDPLPQAMILTAIVITLGFTAFMLAMAYRSWRLNGHDEVQDDVEDRRLAALARQEASALARIDLDEEAAEARDEPEDDPEEELEDDEFGGAGRKTPRGRP